MYALDWLCAWLLEQTAAHCDELAAGGQSAFDVRNNSQTFYAAKLSLVYGEVRKPRRILLMRKRIIMMRPFRLWMLCLRISRLSTTLLEEK